MGLLPNGCSRMVTPLSKSACKARGMRDWADWQHLTDDGFVDIPTVDDMVRSTSTAYFLFPNLITPVAASGFPFILFWPLDQQTTRIDWIHYAPSMMIRSWLDTTATSRPRIGRRGSRASTRSWRRTQ